MASCLPFEIGIHLLPVAALEVVEERLRQFLTDRAELVKAFLVAYPILCQDAAKRLRGLYNPADYPPVDDAAHEFGFSWQYVSFGVPDQVKGISREVWEQEREKAAQRMAEASSEIQQVLRQSIADLVVQRLRRPATVRAYHQGPHPADSRVNDRATVESFQSVDCGIFRRKDSRNRSSFFWRGLTRRTAFSMAHYVRACSRDRSVPNGYRFCNCIGRRLESPPGLSARRPLAGPVVPAGR